MLLKNQAIAAKVTGLRSLQRLEMQGQSPHPCPGPSTAQLGALDTQGVRGKRRLFQSHEGLPGSTLELETLSLPL